MKTKKIVVGAIAASMLSLSVCSFAPAVLAAGETVQISASNESAKAGEKFSVTVSLADIPTTRISGIDFAVKFDNSIITIDSVKAGPITETGADAKDASASSAPLFDYELNASEGTINLLWATLLEDSSYWIKDDGVFCTINGTVSSSAANGAVSKIEFIPSIRETRSGSGEANDQMSCGYLDAEGAQVEYTLKATNGSVTVGDPVTTTTTTTSATTTTTVTTSGGNPTSGKATLRGDANCDKQVNMADAVFIMQCGANPDKYQLSDEGAANADVDDSGDVTNKDALKIQQYKLGLIDTL